MSEGVGGEELDWPCTEKCRSLDHGRLVCEMGWRGTEREVVSGWESTCRNYSSVRDSLGRTALHIAASTPNSKVVEWLVRKERRKKKELTLDWKDSVSGYTPLHTAIYFGQILNARILIGSGGSLRVTDNEGLNPIDLCLADRLAHLPLTKDFRPDSDPSELYVWGTNDNFNLGTDTESGRKIPEPLDSFRVGRGGSGDSGTANTCISHVTLQTFHSVFVGQNGWVFSCGVGTNGRLGLGEKVGVALLPQRIPLREPCQEVSAGTDHVLFLLNNGLVKSCGGNENYVLGHGSEGGGEVPLKLFHPRTIQSLRPISIQGVRASPTHSVFFHRSRVWTCGVNEGQLGHVGQLEPPPSHVIQPTLVTCVGVCSSFSSSSGGSESEGSGNELSHVECNSVATAVRTHKGIITLLYRHQARRIHAQHLAVKKMVVMSGEGVGVSGVGEHSTTTPTPTTLNPLTLFLLTKTGSLVIWREDVSGRLSGQGLGQGVGSRGGGVVGGTFTQVVMDLGRSVSVKDMALSRSSVVVVGSGGEAFMGHWTQPGQPQPPLITPNRNSEEEREKRRRKGLTDTDLTTSTSTWLQTSRKTRGGKGSGGESAHGFGLEHIKMRRVANIHGGEGVACDPKGNNFAIIQRSHSLDFLQLPSTLPSRMKEDLERVFQEMSVEDILHDVEFKVEYGREDEGWKAEALFPGHRFILATFCPQLYALVKEKEGERVEGRSPVQVHLPNTHPWVFQQILAFVYTGTCSVLHPPTEPPRSLIPPQSPPTPSSPCPLRMTQNLARELKLESLVRGLNSLHMVQGVVELKGGDVKGGRSGRDGGGVRKTGGRKSHSTLTDVSIESSDHFIIPAHKCMLVSRMEYFNMMMGGPTWAESRSGKVRLSVKRKTVESMLDWVYEERVSGLKDLDPDTLRELFMATDLFGMDELRAWVEVTLAHTISLKTVAQLLTQAMTYNAHQLRDSCLNFIGLNLPPLLENGLLDGVDREGMEAVGEYYREFHPHMKSRQLHTPIPTPLTPHLHPHPSTDFEDFLLYSEEGGEEEDYGHGVGGVGGGVSSPKTAKTKGRRVRVRTRTESCGERTEGHGDGHGPLPLTPVQPPAPRDTQRSSPIPIPTSTTSAPGPGSGPTSKTLPLRDHGRSGSSGSVILPRNLHFPSLSKLVSSGSEDYTPSSVSPPQTHPQRVSGSGRKKVKWRSLVTQPSHSLPQHNANDKDKEEKREKSEGERDPLNPWQRFKTESQTTPTPTGTTPLSPISPQTQTQRVSGRGSGERTRTLSEGEWGGVTQPGLGFHEILSQEQEMKDNLQRATHKPLKLLQIEELGMEELRRRYWSEKTSDGTEILVVDRLTSNKYARPSWPHSSSPKSNKPPFIPFAPFAQSIASHTNTN